MSFGSAIILGIGFMIGVAIFIISIIILISFLKRKKSKFTAEMFEDYKLEVISEERYEEVKDVDKIIESIKKGKPDKNLLSNYEIKKTSELILESKNDEKTSIRFKDNAKVVLKKRKNKK